MQSSSWVVLAPSELGHRMEMALREPKDEQAVGQAKKTTCQDRVQGRTLQSNSFKIEHDSTKHLDRKTLSETNARI